MSKKYTPRITTYENNLNTVLEVGPKSIRYQLNEWSEAASAEWPGGKPVGDVGRTLDAALRAARRKARRAKGTILLVAYQWTGARDDAHLVRVGTVFEVKAAFTETN